MTIAVYTTLFGPYDHILPALHDEADYILFTDQEGVEAPGWQVRQVKRPHPDGCYASRFYFDQASMVLPEYYLTIMHGANAQLIMPPCGLVAMLRPDHDIACFAHAHRTNVYEQGRQSRYPAANGTLSHGPLPRKRAAVHLRLAGAAQHPAAQAI